MCGRESVCVREKVRACPMGSLRDSSEGWSMGSFSGVGRSEYTLIKRDSIHLLRGSQVPYERSTCCLRTFGGRFIRYSRNERIPAGQRSRRLVCGWFMRSESRCFKIGSRCREWTPCNTRQGCPLGILASRRRGYPLAAVVGKQSARLVGG